MKKPCSVGVMASGTLRANLLNHTGEVTSVAEIIIRKEGGKQPAFGVLGGDGK